MGATGRQGRLGRAAATSDRVGLWVVGIGAAVVAVLQALRMVVTGADVLGRGPVEVTDMALVNASRPAFTESLGAVSEARYESVTVVVEGLPTGARWLLWAGDAVGSLAAVGICLALVWLCVRVGRGRPFGPSVTPVLLVTAGLIALGGLGRQVLGALGRGEVVQYLGDGAMGRGDGAGSAESFPLLLLGLDLTPLGIALAFGVLAAAFEIGERLQRDTEGLV